MYKNTKVSNTLNDNHLTTPIKNTRQKEFVELVKTIHDFKKDSLNILDIGVGDGRIPVLLSTQEKTWNKVALYVGIDNSKMEISKASTKLKKRNLRLINSDANNLNKTILVTKNMYDLVICTYFTAGNFKPQEISLKTGTNNKIVPYPKNILRPNTKFVSIFKSAYKLLNPGGKIVLGSVYIDSEATRLKQELFYKKCGMKIITTPKDSFTATLEGFWSQRFTKDRIYDYFDWINKESIEFIPLDRYNFAWTIIISK